MNTGSDTCTVTNLGMLSIEYAGRSCTSCCQIVPGGANGRAGVLNRVRASSLYAHLHIDDGNHRINASLTLGGLDALAEDDEGPQVGNGAGISGGTTAGVWHQSALPLTKTGAIARLGEIGRGVMMSSRYSARLSHPSGMAHRSALSNPRGSTIALSPAGGRSMITSRLPVQNSTSAQLHLPLGSVELSSSHLQGPNVGRREASTRIIASTALPPAVSLPSSRRLASVASRRFNGIPLEGEEGGVSVGIVEGGATWTEESDGPLLVVEHCCSFLPPDLARLPELDLGEGLRRPLHCYAHGGFMGAAISMLADPNWEDILLQSVKDISTGDIVVKVRVPGWRCEA